MTLSVSIIPVNTYTLLTYTEGNRQLRKTWDDTPSFSCWQPAVTFLPLRSTQKKRAGHLISAITACSKTNRTVFVLHQSCQKGDSSTRSKPISRTTPAFVPSGTAKSRRYGLITSSFCTKRSLSLWNTLFRSLQHCTARIFTHRRRRFHSTMETTFYARPRKEMSNNACPIHKANRKQSVKHHHLRRLCNDTLQGHAVKGHTKRRPSASFSGRLYLARLRFDQALFRRSDP